MPNKVIVPFANRKPVKLSKWKIEKGQTVYHGRVLLQYLEEADGKLSTLKSKCVGTVVALMAKEGEMLNPGDPLMEVEEGCAHPTVINDLCAECGADLQREGAAESSATVPMVHHIPQLKVSQQEAEIIGKADTDRLLRDRKLVLLVDLDQTLIHTTHDNIPNNIKDVFHFQLGTSAWYHTRLRPNTWHFLKEMNCCFELHICTFGVRPYAHTVASILDKDQSLFSNRILSRDECFSHNSKVANLQALFPNGDELVCIIDDRKDVWNNSPNLIPVKPYVFFTNTGDINDPNLPPVTKHSDFFAKGVTLKRKESEGEKETKEGGQSEEFDVEDEDDYLLYLETILKRVHHKFYQIFDKKEEGEAHVRWVLEQLRGGVLRGCEIVFSGLVPLSEGLENSEPYLMAIDLGAKISKIVSKSTTHIVAARQGTEKLRSAKKFPHIKVVNPQWLTTCLYRWERVDERLFPLSELKDRNGKDEPKLALTFDDFMTMQHEVQAEFNSDSSKPSTQDNLTETLNSREPFKIEVNNASDNGVVEADMKSVKIGSSLDVVKIILESNKVEGNVDEIREPVDEISRSGDGGDRLVDTSDKTVGGVGTSDISLLTNVDCLIELERGKRLKPECLEFLLPENGNLDSVRKFQIPKRKVPPVESVDDSSTSAPKKKAPKKKIHKKLGNDSKSLTPSQRVPSLSGLKLKTRDPSLDLSVADAGNRSGSCPPRSLLETQLEFEHRSLLFNAPQYCSINSRSSIVRNHMMKLESIKSEHDTSMRNNLSLYRYCTDSLKFQRRDCYDSVETARVAHWDYCRRIVDSSDESSFVSESNRCLSSALSRGFETLPGLNSKRADVERLYEEECFKQFHLYKTRLNYALVELETYLRLK